MEIKEIFSIVESISKGIETCKSASNMIPKSLFMPRAKKNIQELETELILIQGKIDTLEEKFNTGFPELSRLVRSYSRLISDVRIAGALSDKAAELYGIAPQVAPVFTSMFANDRQNDYARISSSISQIPELDVSEKGKLEERLVIIRDYIRDLKNSEQSDVKNIKRLLDSISTQYADIESILSKLLERILLSLEPLIKQ